MASSGDSSPVSSQLSSHGSSEFGDVKAEDADSTMDNMPSESHLMPPAKRRRLNNASNQSTPIPHLDTAPANYGEISEDTDGSIPPSPSGDSAAVIQDEDPRNHVQVRHCKWDGCEDRDMGNNDNLVAHLHDDHIGGKETNYACEWSDCPRKSTPHASGYALKAHMRSHTKEKPFFCVLPECDRSFTRSDALAKHMRTVHETEALRPSDPVPRHHSAAGQKPQRLKLILNSKPPGGSSNSADDNIERDLTMSPHSSVNGDVATDNLPPLPFEYPADIAFTESELDMRPDQLFRLLRRQLAWSERDGRTLGEEVKVLEKKRRDEWTAKELVLANLMEAEAAAAVGHANGESERNIMRIVQEDLPGTPLPLRGEVPWYRALSEERVVEGQGMEVG